MENNFAGAFSFDQPANFNTIAPIRATEADLQVVGMESQAQITIEDFNKAFGAATIKEKIRTGNLTYWEQTIVPKEAAKRKEKDSPYKACGYMITKPDGQTAPMTKDELVSYMQTECYLYGIGGHPDAIDNDFILVSGADGSNTPNNPNANRGLVLRYKNPKPNAKKQTKTYQLNSKGNIKVYEENQENPALNKVTYIYKIARDENGEPKILSTTTAKIDKNDETKGTRTKHVYDYYKALSGAKYDEMCPAPSTGSNSKIGTSPSSLRTNYINCINANPMMVKMVKERLAAQGLAQ